MQHLIGSVGLGGRNHPFDVAIVQRLLFRAGISPGPLDQRCGILTIRAIEQFQHNILPRPDGRVDVGGPTWVHLQRAVGAAGKASPIAQDAISAVTAPISATASHSASTGVPTPFPPRPMKPGTQISTTDLKRPGKPESSAYWQAVTPLVPLLEVNRGLQSPPNRVVMALLGEPTGPKTAKLTVTAHAGLLHITGLRPAIDSLSRIMAQVQIDLPDLYGLIKTPGMRAVRAVRGRHNYSNHSWGIAIDLRVGALVPLGAPFSVRGIDALVSYFNAAGWYWGGGYHGRKDPMHFECSTSLLQSFHL